MTDILNELKMKRYILILVGIYITMAIKGQHINVAAPSRVNVGENFRVAYTVSTQDVDDFRSNMRSTDEVEVIAGPYASKVSSFSMVNGHTLYIPTRPEHSRFPPLTLKSMAKLLPLIVQR